MERLQVERQVEAVPSIQVSSSPIGLGFEKLDRDVFDPEKAYDKVAALGVKWIRIQSGWARTEKEKGVYDFTWLDSIVDNLIQRGLQPWICLCYGNGLYTEAAQKVFGAVGCPPISSEAERQAWHKYVVAVTQRYKEKVQWYEVWNEPDGGWCWKHGPSGTEYGEFVKATALAVKEGDPDAKVIGGVMCLDRLNWLNDVFQAGAAEYMDAFSYHAYNTDEREGFNRVKAMRALCHAYNPNMEIIQGETGTQSRSDGAGALAGGAWTPRRQAKFMARHMMADLFDDVKFASYFSCMDMIEALNGTVGDKASYLDYGYFGVLSAEFDENGISTGEYSPKPSYRTLQVIAAMFRESVEHVELPVLIHKHHSNRIMRIEDGRSDLLFGGFRKETGSSAFVYWRPTELMTTEYESTITLEVAAIPGKAALVDLLDGNVYSIPESMVDDNGRGHRMFKNLPLKDYPMALIFGDYA
ncbi:MAG: beta-galactosidase [Planctomycetes bacterium]|nr:beta-galactosidase [Planctomycetota bacterium]